MNTQPDSFKLSVAHAAPVEFGRLDPVVYDLERHAGTFRGFVWPYQSSRQQAHGNAARFWIDRLHITDHKNALLRVKPERSSAATIAKACGTAQSLDGALRDRAMVWQFIARPAPRAPDSLVSRLGEQRSETSRASAWYLGSKQ